MTIWSYGNDQMKSERDKRALRSSLECKIGTAVEPFREKNNNVNKYQKWDPLRAMKTCLS